MNKPLVYIIALNWNQLQDTLEFLESIQKQTYPNLRILVVDNGSKDGSPQVITERYPQVEQIVFDRNMGVTGGMNAGFHHALSEGAEYIFQVNNDTLYAPDVIELLVAAAEPEDVGIVGPLIFYASAPEKIWSAGSGRSRLTLELTENHGRKKVFSQNTEREFLASCAYLIKRSVLEKVGLLDERFFPIYYDDSDYCLRVRQAGYRILLVPQARMWHKVSLASGGSGSPRERYLMARNSVIFFRKHIRGWRWLFVIPWRVGSTIKTLILLGLYGRFEAAASYLRGIRDGLRFQA